MEVSAKLPTKNTKEQSYIIIIYMHVYYDVFFLYSNTIKYYLSKEY